MVRRQFPGEPQTGVPVVPGSEPGGEEAPQGAPPALGAAAAGVAKRVNQVSMDFVSDSLTNGRAAGVRTEAAQI